MQVVPPLEQCSITQGLQNCVQKLSRQFLKNLIKIKFSVFNLYVSAIMSADPFSDQLYPISKISVHWFLRRIKCLVLNFLCSKSWPLFDQKCRYCHHLNTNFYYINTIFAKHLRIPLNSFKNNIFKGLVIRTKFLYFTIFVHLPKRLQVEF